MIAQPSDSVTIAPDLLQIIQTKVQTLPPERQQQVLDFVEFLEQKKQTQLPQKTIWEKIRERAARIPPEEWEKLPTDGSCQHDHYLYGIPKREL